MGGGDGGGGDGGGGAGGGDGGGGEGPRGVRCRDRDASRHVRVGV